MNMMHMLNSKKVSYIVIGPGSSATGSLDVNLNIRSNNTLKFKWENFRI